MLKVHPPRQCFKSRCSSNTASYFRINYSLNVRWIGHCRENVKLWSALRDTQILCCDSQNGCWKWKALCVCPWWLIILTSVDEHIWLFKKVNYHATHTHKVKKGGPVTHASVRPINSCQSGNRPVNIEGSGGGGGNERGKGNLVPSPLSAW